jgi:hypothetical protein
MYVVKTKWFFLRWGFSRIGEKYEEADISAFEIPYGQDSEGSAPGETM